MWIFLFFVAPLLALFVWAWLTRGAAGEVRGIPFLALLPAVAAALGLIVLVSRSDSWQGGRQLAWLGVDTLTPSDRLTIGGDAQGTGLGWPDGFAWPQLAITEAQGGAAVEVRGGGGLVEVDDTPVNGEPLGAADVEVRGFRLRVVAKWTLRESWWRPVDYLEIRPSQSWTPLPSDDWRRWLGWSTGADPPLVAFPLRQPASGVVSIADRVARSILRLRQRKQRDDLALALAFEEWAADIRLSILDGHVRVLDEAAAARTWSKVASGDRIAVTVRWPRRILRASIWRTPNRLHLRFMPPWRTASSIPPPPDGSSTHGIQLTLTNTPAPGDHVFALPFGLRSSVRVDTRLIDHPQRGVVFADEPPAAPNILVPPGTPRDEASRRYSIERIRSVSCVTVGGNRPCIGVVEDVMDRGALIQALAVALFCLAVGLGAAETIIHRLRPVAWTLAVLVASSWSLLSVRLLLALRYAIDPAGLDRMAVEGVVNAVFALTVVPASLAGASAVYLEQFVSRDGRPARYRLYGALAMLAGILVAGLIQARQIVRLWPNLPSTFDPGITDGILGLGAVVGAAGLLSILFFVGLSTEARAGRRGFDRVVNWPMRFLQIAGNIWLDSQAINRKRWYWRPWAAAFAAVVLTFGAASSGFGGMKVVTELLYPLLVGVPLVIFWLGALHAYPPGANLQHDVPPRAKDLIVPTLLFGVAPGVAPVLFNDPGALYSMLGILSLTGALLVGSRHPRFGWTLIISSVATLLVAAVTATTLVTVMPASLSQRLIGLVDRGTARVTAFIHQKDVQRMLPLSLALSDTGSGLPADALRGAYQHPWEAGAITYRGGWAGPGFGEGPNRKSNIPQDVLQYDSTISFFVAADHGLLGVFAIFALYLMPFAALTLAARRRFDTGCAMGIVAAGWLVIEAIVHTSVNFGILPFTGRNLPWLAVKSSSDLIRWSVMALLMLYGELWRSTGSEHVFRRSVTLVVDPTPSAAVPVPQLPPRSRLPRWLQVSWRSDMRPLTTTGGLLALMLALLVAVPGVMTLRNHTTYGSPFSWSGFYDEVQMYLDAGKVSWNENEWTLSADPLQSEGLTLDGTSLLEQELARFNALRRDEKSDLAETLQIELRALRTTDDYDRLLRAAAQRQGRQSEPRTLFRVSQRTTRQDDGTEATEFYPTVDRSRDAQISFDADTDVAQLPRVRLRPTAAGQSGPMLIGPAWVSGRWKTASNAGAHVPWVGTLAAGVRAIWGNRAYDNRRAQFGTLTLDADLQAVSQRFVAEKGRLRHGQLLADPEVPHRRQPALGLPPRVALSIVAIPSGEVLALGGWPAASASGTWEESPAGVVPPATWLRDRAPGALAYRYVDDRNFDPIEMGSATKPLWAAAALRTHPRLARALSTRGPAESEREVFGIPIAGAGWTTVERDWTTFRRYLADSDNRYHVRVGFVLLAVGENGLPLPDAQSRSTRESLLLRGAPTPWQRVPQFEPGLEFSAARPTALRDLQNTRGAGSLRQMFAVSLAAGDFASVRRSFWSLDERDDRQPAGNSTLPALFRQLAPAVPQFQLNRVTTPRQYVNLLLGGGTNRWANVDFAAAFATAITGQPILARAVSGVVTPSGDRVRFPDVALELREPLRDTVVNGTARGLAATEAWFRSRRVAMYGKTGTLSTDGGRTDTSRLVVALVRWRNETRGEADGGLVLSLVGERADVGYAARWLAEFIDANRELLLQRLNGVAVTP
jgi:cell division protein FtsW (lipid II flippase)